MKLPLIIKLPFVSRKKYEIKQNNYKESVKHRQDLQKRNQELQKEKAELKDRIKKLEENINELKPKVEKEVLRRCSKCNKYFTVSKVSKRTICMDCKNKKKEDK